MWHCLSQITQHSSQIWPNLPDCFIRCILSVNAKHQSKTLWYFGKWFASKARKLSLKVYDGRNTSMCHTVPLGFCSKCMLSLNMGLTGLSEITRLSEIRRLYPICEIFRFNHSFLVIFFTIWYSGWGENSPADPSPLPASRRRHAHRAGQNCLILFKYICGGLRLPNSRFLMVCFH